MIVADVRTRTPIAVGMDGTLLEAAKITVDARVSGLPVIDTEGALVGIISRADLLRALVRLLDERAVPTFG
jgi:CBS domain-containing protein